MIETPTRRGLITGLVSFLAAPAIVRASSLMPIRGTPLIKPLIVSPEWKTINLVYKIMWDAEAQIVKVNGISAKELYVADLVAAHPM